jgi:hypothetical protein
MATSWFPTDFGNRCGRKRSRPPVFVHPGVFANSVHESFHGQRQLALRCGIAQREGPVPGLETVITARRDGLQVKWQLQ